MLAETKARTANDWTLVAVLHHRAGQPTGVEVLGGSFRIDADAWTRTEGWCEHCRTRRARSTTYLLRDSRGRLAQVGANCLADFTGHPRARDLLTSQLRGRTGHRALRARHGAVQRSSVEYIDLRCFLAQAVQAVFDVGFTSASTGSRRQPPTWRQAATAVESGRPPSRQAVNRAAEVVRWAREELSTQKDPDEFERRLVQVLGQERLTRRELPTAAAAVHSYHRHLRRKIAARQHAVPPAAPGSQVRQP